MSASTAARARRWWRAGWVLGGALALFVVVGGFLHTPAGRPLLAKLAGKACPFGREKLEPVRREALRREGLGKFAKIERSAPVRSALGFELGSARRADVTKWAAEHRLGCRAEAQGAGLACDAVPGGLVGETGAHVGSLTFRFDPRERLVAVLRMVRTPDAARAVALAEEEQSKLRDRFGTPTRAFGELSVASLEKGALRQARAEYRYRDFSTFASVTNLGHASYLVTEEAQLAD